MHPYETLVALEVHAGGEPGRVIVDGVGHVPGATMFEKMCYLRDHADGLRRRMLREPRGYPGLCCNVLLPPVHPDADAGFVIMEQSEYPAMSGSNTICVTTALVETGRVPVSEPVTRLTLEAPAGLIQVKARVENGRCVAVSFDNVPAFAAHLDVTVQVPELREVTVDLAWGGMWYVIADADALGIPLTPDHAATIARVGQMLRAAAAEQLPVVHPENPALAGVSIAQLSGRSRNASVSRRNAVVITTGELDWERPDTWRGVLDRSPCGTGTCAKMAALHARGELAVGEDFRHEGILARCGPAVCWPRRVSGTCRRCCLASPGAAGSTGAPSTRPTRRIRFPRATPSRTSGPGADDRDWIGFSPPPLLQAASFEHAYWIHVQRVRRALATAEDASRATDDCIWPRFFAAHLTGPDCAKGKGRLTTWDGSWSRLLRRRRPSLIITSMMVTSTVSPPRGERLSIAPAPSRKWSL